MTKPIKTGSPGLSWLYDPRPAWVRMALFAFICGLTGQVLVGNDVRLACLGLFVMNLALWGLLAFWTTKAVVPGRALLMTLLAAVVAMVAVPPATSLDFNSYAVYGRMAAEYGASPYTHVPRDFAADYWYARISYYWTDAPSVYGPVFTAISTAVMAVAGTSVLATRLGFAGVAATFLLLSVALAATRMGRGRAIVFVGLNPLLLTFGVNDAHCDLITGALVLGAALALFRQRAVWGGVVLALAAMVKVSVLPAFLGGAVWLWFKVSRRAAAMFVASGVAVMAAGVAVAGGLEVLTPLAGASGRHTRFSVWAPVHAVLDAVLSGGSGLVGGPADRIVGLAASACVAGVGIFLIWRHRKDAHPFLIVPAGLVAYQVLGAYTLSWYAAWSLAVLALVPRSRLFQLTMAHGCFLAIAYLSGWGALVLALAAVAVVIASSASREAARTFIMGDRATDPR